MLSPLVLVALAIPAQAALRTPEQIKAEAMGIRAIWRPRKAWLDGERTWLRNHDNICTRGNPCAEFQRRLSNYQRRLALYKKAYAKYQSLKKLYFDMIRGRVFEVAHRCWFAGQGCPGTRMQGYYDQDYGRLRYFCVSCGRENYA